MTSTAKKDRVYENKTVEFADGTKLVVGYTPPDADHDRATVKLRVPGSWKQISYLSHPYGKRDANTIVVVEEAS